MVIFDLSCPQNHRFEGWFSNREEFLRQLEKGLIQCPLCGSSQIAEKLSAPKVHVERRTARLDKEKRRERQLAILTARPAAPPDQATGSQSDEPAPPPGESSPQTPSHAEEMTTIRTLSRAIQEILDRHFEDVGSHFYDEAIAIHLGEANPRNLKGTASPQEEEELTELGVPFGKIRLPRFDD
ncbi:MAG: DUF1178 family protein [Bradymonadales bacterium]|nr:DUF1178 family protein [Bradymonadales bacterium]